MSYQITDEVIESGRRAWNKLEGLFSSTPEFYDPESAEFALFYEQLCTHLLTEETEV